MTKWSFCSEKLRTRNASQIPQRARSSLFWLCSQDSKLCFAIAGEFGKILKDNMVLSAKLRTKKVYIIPLRARSSFFYVTMLSGLKFMFAIAGEFDKATKDRMVLPFCEVKESIDNSSRSKRHILQGTLKYMLCSPAPMGG